MSPAARERLGYPTQNPLALLERIIAASSNEGDLVLDPFCGCGTTVDAARRLKRRWCGIDISAFAVDLVKQRRLRDPSIPTLGIPADLEAHENWRRSNRSLSSRGRSRGCRDSHRTTASAATVALMDALPSPPHPTMLIPGWRWRK